MKHIIFVSLALALVSVGRPGYTIAQEDGKLQRALERAKAAGNEAEVREIEALMKRGKRTEASSRDNEDRRRKDEADFLFPLTARLHIPDGYCAATLIDGKTPLDELFRTQLKFQFVIVEEAGKWTLFSHRQVQPNSQLFPTVEVKQSVAGFTLTFIGVDPNTISQAGFDTMSAAIADYQHWLEQAYEVGRIGKQASKPGWLANVKLVFTVDMWRPNGEISHDYQDVINLIEDLSKAGAPDDTLLYLPGWSGPYDGWYPEYAPVKELGGARKFRELVQAAHKNGYRVMIHTAPGLVDPYQPEFEARLKNWARRDDAEREFEGWPGGIPTKPMEFNTGRQPLKATTASVMAPDVCEARVAVGGLNTEPLSVTIGDRTLRMPADASDPYTFPFPFFFRKGENQITFSGSPPRAWYRVHEAVQFPSVWTRPMVAMRPDSLEWRAYFVEKVERVVNEFGVDAVHLDAVVKTWEWVALYAEMQRRLPGVAVSNEKNVGEAGLRFISLTQGGGGGGLEELPRWRKASSVSRRLTEPYLRAYWHLCAAKSFAPVGSVCNVGPPAVPSLDVVAAEDKIDGLHRLLNSVAQLGVSRTLRLNYRQYGLDVETRREVNALK
jgi:protein tyrosine phosphatase (PTP) superfamily phosphohydrolase (DUF442 family)